LTVLAKQSLLSILLQLSAIMPRLVLLIGEMRPCERRLKSECTAIFRRRGAGGAPEPLG
jgi:hypothetical protein